MLHRPDAFQGYLWNKIFLREIIEKENICFDSRVKIWEDMIFCLKYLTKIESVNYIGKPVYYYVQRENSAMNDADIWKENTQLAALDEMWKITRNREGPFHDYIRDFYANDLAGLLGKPGFQDRDSIADTLKIIKSMRAKLSMKHKVKIMLFQCKKW